MAVVAETTSAAPRAVLTISRQFGSGGREIGRAVAERLGYRYVDRDTLLGDIRKDGPRWEQWAKELDEHRPTVWERYDWSYRGFAALLQQHLLEHALRGGVVIMGRGGNVLLKGIPHAFRIRVEASPEARIERIMQRESVDRTTALWLCERTDHDRASFLHAISGIRWDDPAEYDRVYSVAGPSVDAEVGDIVSVLSMRTVTDAGLQDLRLRAAAARVKAGIATDPSFFIPVLDVIPDGAGLVLRATTHTPQEHKRIDEAARRLAGNILLRCELHYRT